MILFFFNLYYTNFEFIYQLSAWLVILNSNRKRGQDVHSSVLGFIRKDLYSNRSLVFVKIPKILCNLEI